MEADEKLIKRNLHVKQLIQRRNEPSYAILWTAVNNYNYWVTSYLLEYISAIFIHQYNDVKHLLLMKLSAPNAVDVKKRYCRGYLLQ